MSREAICRGRRRKADLRGKDGETAPRAKIPRLPGEHFYSGDLGIFMSALTVVENNQIIASAIRTLTAPELTCRGSMPPGHMRSLLGSRERTQRFTGVKLARLNHELAYRDLI